MEERIQILFEHIIDEKSDCRSISKDIKTILSDFNISEIELLSILSQKLKIDQNNVDNIIANSKYFKCLNDLVLLYKDIIDNSSIKQKNFVNILIIDHLLLNITESNIEQYVICANLFLYDMDINSLYKIIVTHCIGRPNSIYEICLFWKRLIEIHKSHKMIPSILHNNLKYSCYSCELGKIDYFLRYFNILEEKPAKLNQRIFKRKYLQKEFEMIKKSEVSNPLFKAIHDDNIEELGKISSCNNFDINCSILNSMETINSWHFDFKDKIQLIKLAAFSKSVKVFKYLIVNHAEIDDDLIDYAIAGGDAEIIRICQQQKCTISLQSFEYAIKYYQNDILLWLIEQNLEIFKNYVSDIFYQSIFYSNPQALLIILDNDNFCFNQDNFCFFEEEWISFLFTTQFFEDKTRKAIQNADFGYITKHNIHVFEKYLKNRGELEQYKNKTLLPPYPNELILKVVIEKNYYCKNISVAGFSQEFLVFLFENHFFYFYNEQNKNLGLKSVFYGACLERIEKGDINLLYEIERSNPLIIQKVYNYVFHNKWTDIMTNNPFLGKLYHDLKKYFMERCLIDNELNFDIQTEGFCYSCFYGKNDLVCDFLNRKYIDVNSKKYLTKKTPLINAIRCGYTSIVQLLINDKRIDVNLYCDEKHQTPFYYACEDNYIDFVELLLKDERVDINIPNIEGKTPFLVACEKGYYKIVKRLLQRKDLIKGSPFNLAVTNWQYKKS